MGCVSIFIRIMFRFVYFLRGIYATIWCLLFSCVFVVCAVAYCFQAYRLFVRVILFDCVVLFLSCSILVCRFLLLEIMYSVVCCSVGVLHFLFVYPFSVFSSFVLILRGYVFRSAMCICFSICRQFCCVVLSLLYS